MESPQPPGTDTQITRRRTIGYMTNGIYGDSGKGGYNFSLWKGIQETAQAHNVNVVCFIGGYYRISSTFTNEYQRNNVFDLISNDHLDGLIIASAILTPGIGSDEFKRYYAEFDPKRIVSIGVQIDDFHNLFVDNRTGAKKIVDHLIETHGFRRIVYIRGPKDNVESEARYHAYLDSLREHDIPFDPELVLSGDFIRSNGEDLVNHFLEEKRTHFEAIVAANDNMALGAIAALRSRGVIVPDEVAVVGFDDIPDAIMSFPTLTTVRQPIYEVGKRAVELLLNSLDDGDAPSHETLPTDVVIRNSCGCFTQDPLSRLLRHELVRGDQKPAASRDELVQKMVDGMGCTPVQRWQATQQIEQLLDGVLKVLESEGAFGRSLEELAVMMAGFMEKGPLLPWHRAISVFAQNTRDGNHNAKWQGIWQLISEIAWFSQSFERLQEHYQAEMQSNMARGISQALVTTFNIPELMELVWRMLPRLGIKGCWVFLYEQPGPETQMVRLRLAYSQAGRTDLPEEGRLYPARWFLPEDVNHNQSFEMMVSSLYYGDTYFGYIFFEMDEPDQQMLEMIASQISTALQGIKVVSELQRLEAEFRRQANTDLLTGIYNRRMLYSLGGPAFELAFRHKLPLSVAMIDVDFFKGVNDHYGHAVGDQVLNLLSRFIKTQIRGADIFGRFGGEEFLIILPETSVEGATFLVDRIRNSINFHPFQVGELSISLTVSIGLATLNFDVDQIIDNLIDKADKALYKAKQDGRNRVAIYGDDNQPPK